MNTGHLLVILLLWVVAVRTERVVFFPFFQPSHVTSFIRVAQALSERGHQTYVCLPRALQDKQVLSTHNISVVPYGEADEDFDRDFFHQSGMLAHFWEESLSTLQVLSKVQSYMQPFSYRIFTDSALIATLESIQPDYFILDSMPLWTNSFTLPYKFQKPFSVLGLAYNIIGARVPFSPAAVPNFLSQEGFVYWPTFSQRLGRSCIYFMMLVTDPLWVSKIAETLVPEQTPPPSSRSIITQSDLHLIENDVILGYSYPQLANTIMIGGTSAVPAKPLPRPFSEVLDKSRDGLILVSFGSSIESFPAAVRDKILSSLRSVPYNSIWRINESWPHEQKVTTWKWLPQNDILGHNNGSSVRVFVSHCGAWSQYEALYHGVPLLCLPIFADQFFNAHRILDKGFGTFLDVRRVSAEELASAIQEVAQNETYRRTIRLASSLYKELYGSARHKAAYWIDHVLRHGGRHLRAAGQDMPFYQLMLLDVLLLVSICAGFLVVSCVLVSRCCLAWCLSRRTRPRKEKAS